MPQFVNFLGTDLALTTRAELLEAIDQATPEKPVRIATVNPEFMVEAGRNPRFKESLGQMTHCNIDGSGLYFMLKFWNRVRKQKLSLELYHGSDMVQELFDRYQEGQKKFFLVGGHPGLSQKTATTLVARYPKIAIVGNNDGGIINPQNIQISSDLLNQLTSTNPDISLVAFGAPKQELWIQEVARNHSFAVMAGIGGSFGFFTEKKRAPQWMRSLHLEWLFRGLTEKGHWRRLLTALIIFPLQSLWWILTSNSLRGKLSK